MADEAKGFWSSIPKILTGIAAVITATTGLYMAINSNDAGEGILTPPTPPLIPKPKDPLPKPGQDEDQKPTQTSLKSLIDCQLFPTVNTTASLMSWSNHFQEKILSDADDKTHACNKTIDYRGMAHCKEPGNIEVRQALYETLTLCQAAGIEWTEIEHSAIQK
ncbi:hypothetical protein A9Q88_08365 [Gammaproteobacteria bacterium 50_400_T64]|nr:hypothetical protein A9Q88_08365 [Gammaproteobacteria bacterium 50_400_T64]